MSEHMDMAIYSGVAPWDPSPHQHPVHTRMESHAFEPCPECPGCYWCSLLEEEHEGVA